MIREDLIKWLAVYDALENKPLVSDTIDSLIKVFNQNDLSGINCKECFYKIRYMPESMYDSDFGRTTGTRRP